MINQSLVAFSQGGSLGDRIEHNESRLKPIVAQNLSLENALA